MSWILQNEFSGQPAQAEGATKSLVKARLGNGVGARSGEAALPRVRILADGQQSTLECMKQQTHVCALERYLAVMWKMYWSRERL